MELKEIGINTRNWVDCPQNMDPWIDLMNAALNLRVCKPCIRLYSVNVTNYKVPPSEASSFLGPNLCVIKLMKAAVPAESYVIHLSSASLVSCDVYGQ